MTDIYVLKWSNDKRSYHLSADDAIEFEMDYTNENPHSVITPVKLDIEYNADIQAVRAIKGNGKWA